MRCVEDKIPYGKLRSNPLQIGGALLPWARALQHWLQPPISQRRFVLRGLRHRLQAGSRREKAGGASSGGSKISSWNEEMPSVRYASRFERLAVQAMRGIVLGGLQREKQSQAASPGEGSQPPIQNRELASFAVARGALKREDPEAKPCDFARSHFEPVGVTERPLLLERSFNVNRCRPGAPAEGVVGSDRASLRIRRGQRGPRLLVRQYRPTCAVAGRDTGGAKGHQTGLTSAYHTKLAAAMA